MKIKRIIAILLATLTLMSSFAIVTPAAETNGHVTMPEEGWKTSNTKPTLEYLEGEGIKPIYTTDKNTGVKKIIGYEGDGRKVIYTPDDKLRYMDLRYVMNGYELYVDSYSGEVATRSIETGEILFSNPYTIGDSAAAESTKIQIMSQLAVTYTDVESGEDNTYHSYEWAAKRGQIVVRNIKNGIRVEYTIGREEARLLVPRWITAESMYNNVLLPMMDSLGLQYVGEPGTYPDSDPIYRKLVVAKDENDKNFVDNQFTFFKFLSNYDLVYKEYATNDDLNAHKILKKKSAYFIDGAVDGSTVELARLEQTIKTYAPDYTYEKLDEDHLETEYKGEDKNPPLFKMALEYTLDENGMVVRLPANGIRFNEALYQLKSIDILPYMGAGSNAGVNWAEGNFAKNNTGYTFFPDGSGTLFDFEKIAALGTSTTVTGKVYGDDFAYHTISGSTHQETIRYPVFGIVCDQSVITDVVITEEEDTAGDTTTGDTTTGGEGAEGEEGEEPDDNLKVETTKIQKTSGFVAIVEEGDALLELSAYHAVRTSEYNTVRMTVYPRPQDTYNVADAISVGSNDTWTVVSSRRYTGNYKIRYVLLTSNEVAEKKGVKDYYETSYVGMAKAYREYLEKKGILTRLTSEDVQKDIPLYIETFGAIWSTKKVLSVPVEVTIPLTSFDDIVTMHTDLTNSGITNINFIMKGYTEGGLELEAIPYNLKWEKAVEGEYDFEELTAYAKEKNFGIFPDFDFVFFRNNSLFDGLTLSKHAIKTIDDRYTGKREYSATKQTYISYYDLALSPAYFSRFYEKLTENYLEYQPIGISVSTLGKYLNSDFDEEEPYNREDSKQFTINAFKYLSENYGKVATEGGNAYTWQYVDYITDIALDSSRYSQSAAAVPFLGMVLHGYVQFAGTAVNMEGNIDYAMLKAIESGASLKYILSYQNTNELKEWETLSKYYSVKYEYWQDDVVAMYNEINSVLSGVQTSLITKHEFIEGVRVADDDELINDSMSLLDQAIAAENAYVKAETEAEINAYRNARERIDSAINTVINNSTFVSNKDKYLQAYEKLMATTDAVTAIDYFLLLVADTDRYLKTVENIGDTYTLITEEYINRIISDETLTEEVREAILYRINVDADNDASNGKQSLVEAAHIARGDAQAVVDAIVAEMKVAYDHVLALAAADGAEYVLPEMYNYQLTFEEKKVVEEVELEINVHESDDNMIVYEEFENGMALILNFNNYRVMVEYNGVTYTVNAYDYIVLNKGN